MAYPNISYTDGDIAAAAASMSVYCFNNDATYSSDSGDPSLQSVRTETRNSDGQLTGSVTFIDARTGTLNFAYDLIEDELPGAAKEVKPSYIVSFRSRFYVTGNVSTPVTKGEAVTVAAEVLELQNPFIPELLTLLGQQRSWTIPEGDLPDTLDLSASNTRTGATVTFAVENYDSPGAAAPAGITIDSSTGVVTVANTVAIGVYDLKVIVSDTVTPVGEAANTIKGWGRLTVTVTA